MPTYQYCCDSCQHEFELFQSITEGAKRKCPECGRFRLRRLIGPGAAIVFKGSGFYQTDYRSESYKKAAAAEAKAGDGKANGKPADGSKQSKSESQPANKTAGSESSD